MRFLLVIACCVIGFSRLHAAEDFTAEKTKALTPEATGVPADVFQKLASDPQPTPDKLAARRVKH